MRFPSTLLLGLAAVAACDSTSPQELNLCGTWLMQRAGGGWDTLTPPVRADRIPAVVTIASLSGQDVLTVTADELIAMSGTVALGCPAPAVGATRTVHGSVSGVADGKRFVVKAAGTAHTLTSTTTFDLKVTDGPTDVLAWTSAIPPLPSQTFVLPEQLIFRRDVVLSEGVAMPVLDFASSEAFTLNAAALTIGELKQPVVSETIRFFSGPNSIDIRQKNAVSSTLVGVPDGRLRPGDYNLLTWNGSGGATSRLYYRKVVPTSAALGPPATSGALSSIDGLCIRSRIVVPMQGEYPSFLSARIAWSGAATGSVTMTVSRAAMRRDDFWAVEVPEFPYPACIIPFGLGTTYTAVVGRGRIAVYRGLPGDDGERLMTAGVFIAR